MSKLQHRGETTAQHVTICPNPARVEVYDNSIEAMEKWLESNDTDPILIVMIKDYLAARGESSMVSLIHPSCPSKYSLLARYHDKLGWQHFIECRFVSTYVQFQRGYLRTISSHHLADQWATGLMEQLLGM